MVPMGFVSVTVIHVLVGDEAGGTNVSPPVCSASTSASDDTAVGSKGAPVI